MFLPPFGGGISPLLWWGGGEAQKTLPSFSLPPSIALVLELRRLALQQRCKIQASIFMHLEPSWVRAVRVRARGAGMDAQPAQASEKRVILQMRCKEFYAALTWWAKAGSWKLLTWIRVSPCETTFFLLGARRIVGNGVATIKRREALTKYVPSFENSSNPVH